MKLRKRRVAGILSAATCSVLGTGSQADDNEWDIGSATLYYCETDRVTAVEPVVSATKDLGDGESLSMKLVLDALTGASANGAVPSTMPQTFTTPSGGGGGEDDDDDDGGRGGFYTVAPNEKPFDDTFEDNRVSYSMNWEKPIGRLDRRNPGFSVSAETDCVSLGGNLARISHRSPTADAAKRTVVSRAPAGRLDVVLTTPAPIIGSAKWRRRLWASSSDGKSTIVTSDRYGSNNTCRRAIRRRTRPSDS